MEDLSRALEAILFVAEEPIPLTVLAQVTETPREDVLAALDSIRAEAERSVRGLVLREVGGGWRLYTHPSAAPYIERFVSSVQHSRLSQAALETLGIVAYKQPISRQQVASIRGVDSDGVVQTLVARGLIEEVSRDPGPGQAVLYGTTVSFLERLGLRSLDEMPSIAEMLPAASAADEIEP